jgi:hypothetical protein
MAPLHKKLLNAQHNKIKRICQEIFTFYCGSIIGNRWLVRQFQGSLQIQFTAI